ncbi:type II toxin-antitoxin system ParD family antitoxin [Rhizobium sp. TRM96647]|uniref:ribbon-helix-helix domain-containing protein n=1 Tax=unclassified Rhizobium TaxID=2613769 RepID=UPI0021E90CE7|nr:MULTISPECIES: type II toxin-antitoxin system ParD family antitoxin [unclassified Rhizobium]MCV3737457.1 type II toxin-antitoxin system ParD family antitoxin [Rhizobium sp. TRM96647]MCV3756453.1 type II toxin-antitoxin system ParD family antitoxin [Rhizobium sp. TRM96650]
MTKHTIALPEPIAEYVGRRLADGHYASLSEYLADLVAKEMAEREAAVEQLRELLDEAEDSGVSERGLDEVLEFARSGSRRTVR